MRYLGFRIKRIKYIEGSLVCVWSAVGSGEATSDHVVRYYTRPHSHPLSYKRYVTLALMSATQAIYHTFRFVSFRFAAHIFQKK